jgi:hypothetical protein
VAFACRGRLAFPPDALEFQLLGGLAFAVFTMLLRRDKKFPDRAAGLGPRMGRGASANLA